jgi:hypothetical protein
MSLLCKLYSLLRLQYIKLLITTYTANSSYSVYFYSMIIPTAEVNKFI